MKHIFLNLKRFDVPAELGGVNRLAAVADWGRTIVEQTQAGLEQYTPEQVEFVQFFPEAHLPAAAAAASALGSGISVTKDSVVSTIAATEAAFCKAERVTFAGSRMPASNISTYFSLAKSKP